MKKKNILNLIKYHAEKNDAGFRTEAYEIARYFDGIGNYQLSEYIMALLSDANTFSPQISEENEVFFKRVEITNEPLPLPETIKDNIIGIVNAVGHNAGVNKFLFEGPPGTGKTESVKQIARILDRELFVVEFDAIVDSKLGQTSKNIALLFEEIRNLSNPSKVIILFDEIDAIAIDRINSNDLREMGRATSSVLKGLDGLNDSVILIATTNLFNSFDKALIRRFDSVIDFSQYTKEDLIDIGEILLNDFFNKFKSAGRNMRLFKKILRLLDPIPYPGELKNLIKSSLAFSDPNNEYDYLKRLYKTVTKDIQENNLKEIQEKGFTMRELEILTGISKSQISRELKGDN
ncbi:ATP-binding protein [Clostridioides difficile]|uniref:ATP-binding protein n=1 Tax=Clostridioides difficile TaxID=1496 RepID=UPI00038CD230|nr:ATP-binding protein [Clostridioides difficile]EGT4711342.1 AAA family ATPase [Clostridioides difficile]EGT5105273.1 AAA family ATPase [Clostridioides difficile]EGT5113841.1 AAA family ATPase [Clostridioides difficile]EIS9086494.1 AAA family ATPase [Clostridioides difficile]EQG52983.1 AAA domain family protein [Clostridioides difficile DA00141]